MSKTTETNNQESTKLKKPNGHWLSVLGKVLFIIACFCFLAITIYYMFNRWFVSFQDYGALLGGFAGFFMTASGVVYLVKTIQQTKNEMDETRGLMSNQLAESTFFNLLKQHRDIFSNDRNELISEMGTAIKHINEYAKALQEHSFPRDIYTFYHPSEIYNRNNRMLNMGQSMVHIANLVNTQMKVEGNDEETMKLQNFYHKTLYNNLSIAERLLLGMVVINKLDTSLQEYKFSYRTPYSRNAHYWGIERNGYFPTLKMKRILFDAVLISTLEVSNGTYNLVSNAAPINFFGVAQGVVVKGFHYTIIDDDSNPISHEKSYMLPDNRTNLGFLFNDPELYGQLSKVRRRANVRWRMEVEYNRTTYSIGLYFLTIIASYIQGPDVDRKPLAQYKTFQKLIGKDDFYSILISNSDDYS